MSATTEATASSAAARSKPARSKPARSTPARGETGLNATAWSGTLGAGLAWLALGALLLPGPPAKGREWRDWCGDPAAEPRLGWHFYCDPAEPPAEGEPDEPDEAAFPVPATQESGAVAEIARMRQVLEASRAVAILDPTPENVAAYLYLQQESLQRAATFSDVFRRVVWSTPELDYTLTRPAGALSKQLWSDERRSAQETTLANLGERYGLIYVGDAGCAGCRVFGPLLRAFALRHGLDVLAVSLTGEDLEGWPEAVPDNGRTAELGLQGAPVPAVVLFDTETGQVLPVSFGVVAEDQLAERIHALTALEVGHDY